MSASNPEARALYTRLQEVLCDRHAETLMTYLPVEPGNQLATKSDMDLRFDRLEAYLDLRFQQVDQRLASMEARMDRMDGRFDTVDDRMYGLHEVLRDQYKTYTITMVGGMTALTAIFAALLSFIA